jgi:hypothetical protein
MFFRNAAAVIFASIVACGVGAQSPAAPQELKPLMVEDFLKPAAFAEPRLSRNGRFFAVTIPINGRRNLAVVDLETRKGTALTNFRTSTSSMSPGSATTACCTRSGSRTLRPDRASSTAADCSW